MQHECETGHDLHYEWKSHTPFRCTIIYTVFDHQKLSQHHAPSEPDKHLTHILKPSCFVFLHIPHNLAIMSIIPVIIILVRDRIFQNAAVAVFRHNDRGLQSIGVVFPSRQYSGANICIDPVMNLVFNTKSFESRSVSTTIVITRQLSRNGKSLLAPYIFFLE